MRRSRLRTTFRKLEGTAATGAKTGQPKTSRVSIYLIIFLLFFFRRSGSRGDTPSSTSRSHRCSAAVESCSPARLFRTARLVVFHADLSRPKIISFPRMTPGRAPQRRPRRIPRPLRLREPGHPRHPRRLQAQIHAADHQLARQERGVGREAGGRSEPARDRRARGQIHPAARRVGRHTKDFADTALPDQTRRAIRRQL